MKKELLLLFTVLFLIKTYAQEFTYHTIIEDTNTTHSPEAVFSVDIDGDGDMDVLSASVNDNEIAWFENTDGLGSFGTQQIITTDAVGASAVFSIDIDGDGDIDVLSASLYDNKIAWYENIDGLGSFGGQQIITTDAASAISVYATDIDGDGDMDVLSASANDDKIAWYENIDGLGNFGAQQIITTDAIYAKSVYATDIDGDGDMDVLSACGVGNNVVWYENVDGIGNFGTQQIITTNASGAHSVYATDIDGDGDMDVLSASWVDNKIAWYENTDGLGSFGTQQIITTDTTGALSVYVTDIDGDGDMDVLSASSGDNKIAWYENTDSLGNFGTQQIISTEAATAFSVYATDVDGDGDMDVLSASAGDNKIAWYENTDGLGNFGVQQIMTTDVSFIRSVYATDIDSDGDMDVLSAYENDDKIAWYENIDGLGNFGTQQIITTDAYGAFSVYATDIDGDGDIDVLSASQYDKKIAWYDNTDGLGNFGVQQIITTDAAGASSVYATDIDGDGDMDVLSASQYDNKIAWYENTDGLGSFGIQQIITTDVSFARSVFATDIDGDGDMDVLSASWNDDKIAWYENTDGIGSFGTQQIITTETDAVISVYATDIDGDGDMDVLSASRGDDKITWYENTDGLGSFGGQQIITTDAASAISVYATDIDGDGDMDVLSASEGDNKIAWYENLDGIGSFSEQQIITTNAPHAISVYATDIDSDGDMDVLSASWYNGVIAWHENSTITININQIESLNFVVYPNPVKSILTVKPKISIVEIIICNTLGELVVSSSNKNKINLSSLDQGIYFCKIKDEKGDFSILKIIKK